MHDVKLMQIVYATDYILKESTGNFLIQFGVLHDIIEQLSVFDVLHNEKQVF
jgi:hypothetical protein